MRCRCRHVGTTADLPNIFPVVNVIDSLRRRERGRAGGDVTRAGYAPLW
jgi:hypothetical protein